jgi:amino acid transporter
MSRTATALKRLIVGHPISSGELGHTLLPKGIALPVFASDALSSMAYATQEILLVLALVGLAALSLVVPIAIAVALLLAIVIVSYRQIVRAYPGGGGAYVVAYENLGFTAGLATTPSRFRFRSLPAATRSSRRFRLWRITKSASRCC